MGDRTIFSPPNELASDLSGSFKLRQGLGVFTAEQGPQISTGSQKDSEGWDEGGG